MKTLVNKKIENLTDKKSIDMNKKFSNPQFIINQMSTFIKDGDVRSITDLISAYISCSEKYKNQEEFAQEVGTTRQTLHRLFRHNDQVSIGVLFSCIEQIHQDIG